MNVRDLLAHGLNSVRSYLDTNLAQPIEKTVISPLKAQAHTAVNTIQNAGQATQNYLDQVAAHARSLPQRQPYTLPGFPQMSQPLPGLGQSIMSYEAQQRNLPDWVQALAQSLATDSVDPVNMGSVVGPMKLNLGKLNIDIPEGFIGPLYHGTTQKNLARILDEGIKPGVGRLSTNLMDGVYLSRFPSNSSGYAIDWSDYAKGGPEALRSGVMLRVEPLPLKKMVVDEDAPQVDFHGLHDSVIEHWRDPSIPHPLTEYDYLEDPRLMVQKYLESGFGVEDSAAMSQYNLENVLGLLSPKLFGDYMRATPEGARTLKMLGFMPYDEQIRQAPRLLSSGTTDMGEGAKHLGTMVYRGDIPPSAITVLDNGAEGPLLGNMRYDLPNAYREQQLLERVMSNLITERLVNNLPLDWYMR